MGRQLSPGFGGLKLALALPFAKMSGAVKRSMSVSLRVGGSEFPWTMRPADVMILKEVVWEQTYVQFSVPIDSISSILDLGGHIGFSVLSLWCHFRPRCLHVYEPLSGNFDLLVKNVGTLDGVRCFREAVSTEEKPVAFFEHRLRSTRGSLVLPSSHHADFVAVQVQGTPLDVAIGRMPSPPQLLKFDIEGSETTIFKGSARVREIEWIVGETRGDAGRIRSLLEALPDHDLVEQKGYANMAILLFKRRSAGH
jgi:FkbM family methyltransferase